MRKTLGILIVLALVVTPLSGAHAASTRYKISATVTDDKLDLTSGDGSNRSTRIKGKVTGGKVKGKRVRIYYRNVSTKAAPRKLLGTARLSSSGRFSKKWKPKDGGRYEIDVVKPAGSGKKAGTDPTRVYVYQFVSPTYMFDRAASSGSAYTNREKLGNGSYYRDGYAITGGGRAVFDTRGFHCMRVNFKTGPSSRSTAGRGTIRVTQRRTLVTRDLAKGQVYEASPTVQKKMNARDKITFSVARRADLSDQAALRFVVGRPVAACTYPTRSTPYR
ncbi:hypothetical protein [Aeromicrobium chenweiae]|uniref:hypothetical protein n=1 Tax=Aeromicrobium chenweiae TaxID=2079793 RepID=UPI001091DED7|nr:hypothetical protein [Aeromicrobium chenweiae]TGN30894.1 hypothetical protein E4L97_14845 [Aeromicrobium chenweiae]